MHPDIIQAIVRDRSSRMREQAGARHQPSGGGRAAQRARRGGKSSDGSHGRGSGRSG